MSVEELLPELDAETRRRREISFLEQNTAWEERVAKSIGVNDTLPLPSRRVIPKTSTKSNYEFVRPENTSPRAVMPSRERRGLRRIFEAFTKRGIGPRTVVALLSVLVMAGLLAAGVIFALPFDVVRPGALMIAIGGIFGISALSVLALVRHLYQRVVAHVQTVGREVRSKNKILESLLQKQTLILESAEISKRSVATLESARAYDRQVLQQLRVGLEQLKVGLEQLKGGLEIKGGLATTHAKLDTIAHSISRILLRPASTEKQDLVLSLARCFVPSAVVGHEKRRVGRLEDGGYIMLDDFAPVGGAISAGIGDEVSWDIEIAEIGIPTVQFDHTIQSAPQDHPNLTFRQQRLMPICCDENEVSLDQVVASYFDAETPLILKMDIEGEEWAILDEATSETLERFTQVVCEFHDFQRAADSEWYLRALRVAKKMSNIFGAVHVHGNNFAQLACIGNVVLPSVLEVTFANRRYYELTESNEMFPTPLDYPNKKGVADHFLGRFQF